jgi:regulator of extracellular matrix RemA (YlzA/DUF370 family)
MGRCMESKNFLFVRFGKKVSVERIIAIVNPDSAPMKRFKTDAREQHNLTDLTSDRPVRSIIIMDDNRVILSAIKTETLSDRFNKLISEEVTS